MPDLKAERILCIGGSTLNLDTLKYLREALIKTKFLEEWAIIFTNHLYFKTEDVEVYTEKTRNNFEGLDIVLVYEKVKCPYTVEKGKIYIIPDSSDTDMCIDVTFEIQSGIPILKVEYTSNNELLDAYFKGFTGSHWMDKPDASGKTRAYQPCIDKMMYEVANGNLRKVAGIVLCGLDGDGAYGLQEIARHGGEVAVQEPSECNHPLKARATSSMPNTCLSIVPNCRRISLESVESISNWLIDLLAN
ncbi:MAG: chemotaxis protein CheB [Pseudanabaena sp.]